jgi:Flp pilus assembly pilin Flp
VNTDLSEPEADQRRPDRSRPNSPAESGAQSRTDLGQGLVEYAIIIFLVAIVVIAILLLLGPQIGEVFSSIYATI